MPTVPRSDFPENTEEVPKMSNPLAKLAAYCLNTPPPPRGGTGRTLETLAGRLRDAFQTLREGIRLFVDAQAPALGSANM
jgi:hypothetical protein